MRWLDHLQRCCGLGDDERQVLARHLAELTPAQRRLYRRRIRPRVAAFVAALRALLDEEERAEPGAADRWASALAAQRVSRGHPTLLETLLIEVVGRPRVARRLEMLKRGRVAEPPRRVLR